jgi:hypothetical protein
MKIDQHKNMNSFCTVKKSQGTLTYNLFGKPFHLHPEMMACPKKEQPKLG